MPAPSPAFPARAPMAAPPAAPMAPPLRLRDAVVSPHAVIVKAIVAPAIQGLTLIANLSPNSSTRPFGRKRAHDAVDRRLIHEFLILLMGARPSYESLNSFV